MNKRIRELYNQSHSVRILSRNSEAEKFAELIVEECRNIIAEVYRNTPLELCGPLLTADEEIAQHFYGIQE